MAFAQNGHLASELYLELLNIENTNSENLSKNISKDYSKNKNE